MAGKSTAEDIELKETLDRSRFQECLREFQGALERNQSFDISVNGETFTIPAEAFEKGNYRVEYEIDDGEYEFELTLKWR